MCVYVAEWRGIDGYVQTCRHPCSSALYDSLDSELAHFKPVVTGEVVLSRALNFAVTQSAEHGKLQNKNPHAYERCGLLPM